MTKTEAIDIFRKALPQRTIQKVVEWGDFYIIQAFSADPFEGDMDPYFSVNKNTREVRDWGFLDEGDPQAIYALFEQAT